MNPSIEPTIRALLELGCPPLPVAPAQDPKKPKCHHETPIEVRFKGEKPQQPEIKGHYCRISFTKVGDFQAPVKGPYCRLDENLQPIPRFTGKNPSYLENDRFGTPHIINHREFQNRLPTEKELKKWFFNPANGVGTLGGHNGVVWLDFDRKNYASQEDCDRDVEAIRQKVGPTWVERTGSGGWRIAVRPKQQPAFTNFSTNPDGEVHIGEALFEGRFTVLAPTIHPNGNSYQRIESALPAEIESLESIGIYPTKAEQSNQARKKERERSGAVSAPSSPQDNLWDIRNLAEYLEGCHVDGNYYECRCPVHSGNSDNSLSIAIDTGAFWCWSGCDTKQIYAKAKEVAIAGGYQLPKGGDVTQSRKIDTFRAETAEIQAWMSRLDVEPTKVIRDRYLPAGELPAPGSILLIDAPMGTGKTSTFVKGLVEQQARLHPDGKVISLGSRNALQFQTVRIYGGKHHTEYPTHEAMLSDRWWVGCFDSIWKFIPKRVTPGSMLFLDEISAGLEHLLDGSTVKDKRVFAVNRFRELAKRVIATGGWIVASEDGITNVELDLLKDMVGDLPVTLVKSEWKIETPWQVDLYDYSSITWAQIKARLERGENLILCSDAAKWLRETERFLIDDGLVAENEIWILDSNSSHEGWAHEFMRDPDAWIEQNSPRVFGYSPSIESGVSITHPHFDAMGLHLVNLHPRALKQIPARYRLPVPRFGYVKEYAASQDDSCKSLNPDAILHDLKKTTEGIAKLTEIAEFTAKKHSEQTGEPLDLAGTLARMLSGNDSDEMFWLKPWARIKARQNYGRANLRAELIKSWIAAGHEVNVLETGTDKELRLLKETIRETLDTEESVRWGETDTSQTTLEEARFTLDLPSSTPEDRRKARKRILEDQLPGCDLNNSDFVLKVVVKDQSKFLKATQLLWAVQNPELQKILDRADLFGKIKRQSSRGEIVWRPDIKTKSLQADLIARSPLNDCLTTKAYTDESPQVQKFKTWALWSKAEIKRVMRLTVKDDHSGAKILNKFLRKLGYELSEFKRGPRGEQVRFYQIANFNDVDRNAILAALTRKFQEKAQTKPEMYQCDTVSATCINNNLLQVTDTKTPELDLKATNTDIDSGWLTAESLAEVRQWLELPETDDARAELLKLIPSEVLRRVAA